MSTLKLVACTGAHHRRSAIRLYFVIAILIMLHSVEQRCERRRTVVIALIVCAVEQVQHDFTHAQSIDKLPKLLLDFFLLFCGGSITTISGTPRKLLIIPVTQRRLPL